MNFSPSFPVLSVVIPCYNEELFLADCLASLERQDFALPFEVIVADNNSTDGTAALAQSFGARVVHAAIPGTCSARQTGTEAARGSIVISTDADTVFDAGWLRRVWQAMSEDLSVVAVAGSCKYIDAPWWGSLYARLLFGSVRMVHRLTGNVWYASACNLAFRKASWPGYNTQLTQGGDEFDILAKLKKRGIVTYVTDNPVFTSSRRMEKGFFYNAVVTIFWLYLVNYALGSLVGKSFLGSYPAIRIKSIRERPRWQVAISVAAVVILVIASLLTGKPTFAHNFAHHFGHHLGDQFHAMQERVEWLY